MSTFENIISMCIVFVSCAIVYEFFAYVKRVFKLLLYDALYTIFEPICLCEYTEYIIFINPDGTKYVGKI